MRAVRMMGLIVGMVTALAVAQNPDHMNNRGQDDSVRHGEMGHQGNSQIQQVSDDQWDKKPFSCRRGEHIIGAKVENAQGKDLGQIKDLAIDPASGRIVYGVLSFGGFLGLGEKYFAVPWKSLGKNADGDFVLNVEESRLKNAEGFAMTDWPNMANPEWAARTHEYYGQRPYWQNQSGSTGHSGNTDNTRSSTDNAPGSTDNTRVYTSTGADSQTGADATTTTAGVNRTQGDTTPREPGANSPAGPYAQREPGIDPHTPSTGGSQPGIQPVKTGDGAVASNQGQSDSDGRQLAQGETTGRSEFKSSVGMSDHQNRDLRSAPMIIKATELVGEGVDNRQQESLGSIKDLVIDSNNGRVACAVLARGGVLGMGEELYAIPWEKLNIQLDMNETTDPRDIDDVIVNVDKETLKNAPSFTAEQWPANDEPTHYVAVYRFYAVPQYWQE